MKINLEKINTLIEEGYISKRKHPTEDLWIYNYTHKCQFDRKWTKETMMCRGLIVDKDDTIVSICLKKFFNLEEHQENLPDGDYKVEDKLDGSMGILYWIGDIPYLATRGSFESEQAIKGTEILHKTLGDRKLDKDITLIFEILYRQNRIVIDYGDEEKIVLLTGIDKNGNEVDDLPDYFERPVNYNKKITELKETQRDNAEGYVIKWKDGFRLKVKFAEYVRLHRILTGINERRIWEILRNGDDINQIINKVPDEFYKFVKDTVERLNGEYTTIHLEAMKIRNKVVDMANRKEQAEYIFKNTKYPGIVFNFLDDKQVVDSIWKLLKPEATKPFKEEI